jgi:carboxylesterase
MIGAALLVAILAAWALGRRHANSLERELTARYPRSASGIIFGAEEIARMGTNGAAVLLVHGAGDTPQTLSRVATALNERGYAVAAPLLPGHGRSLAELSLHTADDWYADVRHHYDGLRAAHRWVGVVGLSMGGALSARLAAEVPDVPALVLASPYLVMPRLGSLLTQTSWLWGAFVPYVSTSSDMSLRDPNARSMSLAYGAMSAAALRALRITAIRGSRSLADVRAPTLVVQSTTDNRVATDATRRAYALLGSSDKRIEWIEGAGHVITVDFGWQHVADLIGDWMDAHRRA